jgi:hypothetical protein
MRKVTTVTFLLAGLFFSINASHAGAAALDNVTSNNALIISKPFVACQELVNFPDAYAKCLNEANSNQVIVPPAAELCGDGVAHIVSWKNECKLGALPAWRWQAIDVDQDDSGWLSSLRLFPSTIASLLLNISGLMWQVTLAVLQMGLQSETLIGAAARPINMITAAFGKQLLVLSFLMLGVLFLRKIKVSMHIYPSKKSGGGDKNVGITIRDILTSFIIPTAILAGLVMSANTAVNTENDTSFIGVDKDSRAARVESIHEGQVGTLPWAALQVLDINNAVLNPLIGGLNDMKLGASDGKTGAADKTCSDYIGTLEAHYIATGGNGTATFVAVSKIWEKTFYQSWQNVTFGLPVGDSNLPERAMCHWAENIADVSVYDQYAILQATYSGSAAGGATTETPFPQTVKNPPIILGPFYGADNARRKAMTAWAACAWDGTKWKTTDEYTSVYTQDSAGGNHNGLADECALVMSYTTSNNYISNSDNKAYNDLYIFGKSTKSATTVDGNPTITSSMKAARSFAEAQTGKDISRLVYGILALVVAIICMYSLGLLAVGLFITVFMAIALLAIGIPIALLLSAAGDHKRAVTIYKMTATSLLAKTFFTLLLSAIIVLTNLFQLLAGVTQGMPSIVQALFNGLAPLAAFYVVKKTLHHFGLGNIMTASGAVGFAANSAFKGADSVGIKNNQGKGAQSGNKARDFIKKHGGSGISDSSLGTKFKGYAQRMDSRIPTLENIRRETSRTDEARKARAKARLEKAGLEDTKAAELETKLEGLEKLGLKPSILDRFRRKRSGKKQDRRNREKDIKRLKDDYFYDTKDLEKIDSEKIDKLVELGAKSAKARGENYDKAAARKELWANRDSLYGEENGEARKAARIEADARRDDELNHLDLSHDERKVLLDRLANIRKKRLEKEQKKIFNSTVVHGAEVGPDTIAGGYIVPPESVIVKEEDFNTNIVEKNANVGNILYKAASGGDVSKGYVDIVKQIQGPGTDIYTKNERDSMKLEYANGNITATRELAVTLTGDVISTVSREAILKMSPDARWAACGDATVFIPNLVRHPIIKSDGFIESEVEFAGRLQIVRGLGGGTDVNGGRINCVSALGISRDDFDAWADDPKNFTQQNKKTGEMLNDLFANGSNALMSTDSAMEDRVIKTMYVELASAEQKLYTETELIETLGLDFEKIHIPRRERLANEKIARDLAREKAVLDNERELRAKMPDVPKVMQEVAQLVLAQDIALASYTATGKSSQQKTEAAQRMRAIEDKLANTTADIRDYVANALASTLEAGIASAEFAGSSPDELDAAYENGIANVTRILETLNTAIKEGSKRGNVSKDSIQIIENIIEDATNGQVLATENLRNTAYEPESSTNRAKGPTAFKVETRNAKEASTNVAGFPSSNDDLDGRNL